MLANLSVRHFAVIEDAEVEFRPGLTVVTGETGAGKSLLVDALLLLAGGRADKSMIRDGCERAELHAQFMLPAGSPARAWLDREEMDEDGECQLRRILKTNGHSRAWINGHPASMTQLAELAALLVEIHGQHEHQALLSRSHQRALLDAFAGDSALLEALREVATRWREVHARRKALDGATDHASRIELLRHELEELQRWALPAEALEELLTTHKRLAHAESLLEGTRKLDEWIDGDDDQALRTSLARANAELARMAATDPGLQATLDLLEAAAIQIDEALENLHAYASDIDLDPTRYEQLDRHLQHLHELSRRHRVEIGQLPAIGQQRQAELDELENAGTALADMRAECVRLEREYADLATRLTQARQKAADQLGQTVTGLMQELGMTGAVFAVRLDPRPGSEPDPAGREQVEFLVSANAGQEPRPLRKVASGGELARISLAIEVATLGLDEVGTMVFDEVDAGIGGAVAEVVGQKLRALGEHRQVWCVTHLPQVAAQGHQHLRVHKTQADGRTDTQVQALDTAARQAELARMLGGIRISAETQAHAAQMLDQAQTPTRPQKTRKT